MTLFCGPNQPCLWPVYSRALPGLGSVILASALSGETSVPVTLLPYREPGPEPVCLGPSGRVWVLDFLQERFHHMSPGDYDDTFIKAGGSETRKGLT